MSLKRALRRSFTSEAADMKVAAVLFSAIAVALVIFLVGVVPRFFAAHPAPHPADEAILRLLVVLGVLVLAMSCVLATLLCEVLARLGPGGSGPGVPSGLPAQRRA